MAAYCAAPSTYNGGSIYFPPGQYQVSQYQAVNAAGIPFNIACPGMHLLGGNSGIHNGTPFAQPPSVSIMAHCGPRPNNNPLFATYYPNGNVTFQNLVIVGCNQAVAVTSQVVRFWNTYLTGGSGGRTAPRCIFKTRSGCISTRWFAKRSRRAHAAYGRGRVQRVLRRCRRRVHVEYAARWWPDSVPAAGGGERARLGEHGIPQH